MIGAGASRLWKGVSVAAAAAAFVRPTGGEARSLDDELRYLLTTHPQIEAAESTVAATTAGVDEAFSAFLPSVDLTGNAGYEVVDSPGRRASSGDAFKGDSKKITMTITQNLFDGFRNQSNYAGARSQRGLASSSLDRTRQALLFAGASAYLEVLRQLELLELARTTEATIKRQLQLEDERVRRGSGLAVDVLQAKSRLQLAKEQRILFEGQLQDSLSRFAQVFGRPPEVGGMTDPGMPAELLPSSVEEAVTAARRNNPLLAQSDRQIDIARSQRDAAGADFLPRVDFVVRGNWEEDQSGVEGRKRDIAALVQLTWNLFRGGGTTASVERTSRQFSASMANKTFTDRTVEEEARLAWENLVTTQARAELLRNAVNIAGEVFDAREKLRAAGKESALNVLDAQRDLDAARISYAAATYDARLAAYRLLLAAGRLTAAQLGL